MTWQFNVVATAVLLACFGVPLGIAWLVWDAVAVGAIIGCIIALAVLVWFMGVLGDGYSR